MNRRTVAAMEQIIDAVTLRHDTHGHRLEVCYSIQQVLVLYGEELVKTWQQRAGVYPVALAEKLVTAHLAQIDADIAMHIYREDWLLYYQAMTATQFHLIGALLALNRTYRPELKRLDDLCAEMTIKPENFSGRLKQILRGKPGQAIAELDTLVYEVFGLVETQMPQVDIAPLRMDYQTRRQPFEEPPNDLINQVFRA